MINSLSGRKQYAQECLISGRTGTRAFDNCFENFDGDKVVRFLMKKAMSTTDKDVEIANSFRPEVSYKDWKKSWTKVKLKEAIQESGSWDYWKYFVENGEYPKNDQT